MSRLHGTKTESQKSEEVSYRVRERWYLLDITDPTDGTLSQRGIVAPGLSHGAPEASKSEVNWGCSDILGVIQGRAPHGHVKERPGRKEDKAKCD